MAGTTRFCVGRRQILFQKRTDLALEARELWQESAQRTSRLSGVKATKTRQEGYPVTRVDILDSRGEEALGKPVGSYLTIDLTTFWQRKADFFQRAVRAVGSQLKSLLPPEGSVLVIGLGNDAMTPDAVGAAALEHLLVTRHMVRSMPRQFGALTPVAALATGVLARTGVETLELIRGAADRLHPSVVIAIDALAARSRHRLCATVQLGDTGLIPGSGVGNHRKAVNARTLGVPVIALGVPTVIDGAALCGDEDAPPSGLFVTPQDIDRRVRELGRLIGYGVTLALQPGLTPEDAAALLG